MGGGPSAAGDHTAGVPQAQTDGGHDVSHAGGCVDGAGIRRVSKWAEADQGCRRRTGVSGGQAPTGGLAVITILCEPSRRCWQPNRLANARQRSQRAAARSPSRDETQLPLSASAQCATCDDAGPFKTPYIRAPPMPPADRCTAGRMAGRMGGGAVARMDRHGEGAAPRARRR
eukprot:scaffold4800_cov327-Prasinococcus_capsulatus_cf.AAC.1